MPPQNFWLNRPITRLDDLKGLKVRAWNPEQVEMMKLLGGSAVSITSAEVIPALERKVIDGAITSALSANDWKAYEIVRTGYMVNMTMGHQVMLVNAAELAKLPPDVRDDAARQDEGIRRPSYRQDVRRGRQDGPAQSRGEQGRRSWSRPPTTASARRRSCDRCGTRGRRATATVGQNAASTAR